MIFLIMLLKWHLDFYTVSISLDRIPVHKMRIKSWNVDQVYEPSRSIICGQSQIHKDKTILKRPILSM